MARVNISKGLIEEYQHLFDSCIIREDKIAEIEYILSEIDNNKDRYVEVQENVGVPWYLIAIRQTA